jgi:hypothetical protein
MRKLRRLSRGGRLLLVVAIGGALFGSRQQYRRASLIRTARFTGVTPPKTERFVSSTLARVATRRRKPLSTGIRQDLRE